MGVHGEGCIDGCSSKETGTGLWNRRLGGTLRENRRRGKGRGNFPQASEARGAAGMLASALPSMGLADGGVALSGVGRPARSGLLDGLWGGAKAVE